MNYKFTKEAHEGVKTLLHRDLHGLSIKAQRANKLGIKTLRVSIRSSAI